MDETGNENEILSENVMTDCLDQDNLSYSDSTAAEHADKENPTD